MPLYWTIDSKERLFTAIAEGEVKLTDALDLLDALAGSGAIAYCKLLDARAAKVLMSGDDVLTVCARIRSYHEQSGIGALAIVATAEQTLMFSRLLGALASADRPIKVFETPRRARNWIREQTEARPESGAVDAAGH
ncbi:MAG: hypothetical protein ACOY4R_18155 [Pseudomonadota bacterium]